MLNIPNTITLLRIVAVPVYLSLLVDGTYKMALLVFVAAGVSDAVDGAIARLTDSRTELGAHLDPLADKLLLVSSFIALAILGLVPIQLMIVVIVRDIVIMGGFLLTAVMAGKAPGMAPSIAGKATTFLQILTVALVLLHNSELLAVAPWILWIVFSLTAIACFVSATGYVMEGVRIAAQSDDV